MRSRYPRRRSRQPLPAFPAVPSSDPPHPEELSDDIAAFRPVRWTGSAPRPCEGAATRSGGGSAMYNETRLGAATVVQFIRPDGTVEPMNVDLHYRTDEPHAVTVRFHARDQE